MKKNNFLLFLLLFLGITSMAVTMFHPFTVQLNKLVPTISTGILIILAYIISLSKTSQVLSSIANQQELAVESNLNQAEKSADEIVEEIIKSTPIVTSKSKTELQNAESVLSFICTQFQLSQGILYKTVNLNQDNKSLKMAATYAYFGDTENIQEIAWGEGITGQAAKNNEFIYVDNVPKGLLRIASGLGESNPDFLVISPVQTNKNTVGMIELAGFGKLSARELEVVKKIIEYVSLGLNFEK